MSVLYVLTAPPPALEGTDAVFQDVKILRNEFGGDALNFYPMRRPWSRFPKVLYGLHQSASLRSQEQSHDIVHIFFATLYDFPVLRLLRKPIVYTVVATLDRERMPSRLSHLKSLARIVVTNQRDADTLDHWGVSNFSVVKPGLAKELPRLSPLPVQKDFTLLMASAPWVSRQFSLKGVDALLEAAAKNPDLRLILLWRGLLVEELAERIAQYRVEGRVEVVNGKVDVQEYMARAHAAVLLAAKNTVVKAYPHSLVEALLAGRPVLLSDCIAMADYVHEQQCGVVTTSVDGPVLIEAIAKLRQNYAHYSRNASLTNPEAFSADTMIAEYRAVYEGCTS